MSQKARLLPFFVGLAALAVYLPSLDGEFLFWDDHQYIFENPHLDVLSLSYLRWAFTSFYIGNWHPLTWVSYGVDYTLWGLDPFGYHIVNVVLHALNSSLVTIIVARLFMRASLFMSETGGEALSSDAMLGGTLAGLLFALHPLHVESVAWVSERKDVLYAFFYLLSILFYLKFTSRGRHAGRYYALCLASFTLSLLSKPMAMTLPLVLVLLDWYPLGRLRLKAGAAGRVLREKWLFFVLSIASSAMTLHAVSSSGGIIAVQDVPLLLRFWVSVKALWVYLARTVYPSGLVFLYPMPLGAEALGPEYAVSLVLTVLLCVAVVFLLRRYPLLAVASAFYVITLLPTLGLVKVGLQETADRYMYLAILAPVVLYSAAVVRSSGKARKWLLVASFIFLVLLSAVTVRQFEMWDNSLSLWGRLIEQEPEMADAYVQRAQVYQRAGNYQKAIEDLGRAVTLEPEKNEYSGKRGVVYLRAGLFEEAVKDFSRAIETTGGRSNREKYNTASYLSNRALAYQSLGLSQNALEDFNRAITIAPGDPELYLNRGLALWKSGQRDEAFRDFEKAAALGNPIAAGIVKDKGLK